MNRLLLSPEARNDLAQIKTYIAEELGSEQSAVRTVAGIAENLKRLEKYGDPGARLSSVIDVETDYRFLRCGHSMAFYRFDGETVFIDRILYEKRDYMRVLFG